MSAIRYTTVSAATKFVTGLGTRRIAVIASDATPDRMGDVLEPAGVQLDAFRRNPIVLAQHDATQPIARCSQIGVEGTQVRALIQFPEEGVNPRSDEYYALVKAGVLGAVSVGFMPLEWEPIRGAGVRFTAWDLMELSIVSVPANPSALVTERGLARAVRRLHAPSASTDTADDIRREINRLREPASLDTASQIAAETARQRGVSGITSEAEMQRRRAADAAAHEFAVLRW